MKRNLRRIAFVHACLSSGCLARRSQSRPAEETTLSSIASLSRAPLGGKSWQVSGDGKSWDTGFTAFQSSSLRPHAAVLEAPSVFRHQVARANDKQIRQRRMPQQSRKSSFAFTRRQLLELLLAAVVLAPSAAKAASFGSARASVTSKALDENKISPEDLAALDPRKRAMIESLLSPGQLEEFLQKYKQERLDLEGLDRLQEAEKEIERERKNELRNKANKLRKAREDVKEVEDAIALLKQDIQDNLTIERIQDRISLARQDIFGNSQDSQERMALLYDRRMANIEQATTSLKTYEAELRFAELAVKEANAELLEYLRLDKEAQRAITKTRQTSRDLRRARKSEERLQERGIRLKAIAALPEWFDFLTAFIGSIISTFVLYPIDTIKTRKQVGEDWRGNKLARPTKWKEASPLRKARQVFRWSKSRNRFIIQSQRKWAECISKSSAQRLKPEGQVDSFVPVETRNSSLESESFVPAATWRSNSTTMIVETNGNLSALQTSLTAEKQSEAVTDIYNMSYDIPVETRREGNYLPFSEEKADAGFEKRSGNSLFNRFASVTRPRREGPDIFVDMNGPCKEKQNISSQIQEALRDFNGLYDGVWQSAILKQALPTAINTFIFESVKHRLFRMTADQARVPVLIIAAVVAKTFDSILGTPAEAIKARVQAGVETSEIEALKNTLLTTEGRDASFKGWYASLLRDWPSVALQIGTFEVLLNYIATTPRPIVDIDVITLWGEALISTLTGMFGALISVPFDVITTRILLQKAEPGRESKDVLDVATDIYEEGGFSAFATGWKERLGFEGPAVGIFIFVYCSLNQQAVGLHLFDT